ncbi:DUF6776 family protein [Marinobacter zhejiangensis]|uniref:Uncharacterized protein n=1 Tax=Marinobacter zhejiangensis TaxID=488535 RepID=A0A1I4MJP0_9GAMM|nr:DUF6776 family protein [Marinobacter zhejiangensis]SFM03285.1 hypothetical protein SAMN04487963_1121 [Marinobacter zhejiangensis]
MSDNRKLSEEYVVVRHRPGRRLRRTTILLVFSLICATVGYAVGLAQGGFRFSSMLQTRNSLAEERDKLSQDLYEARQRVVNLERGHQIDEQALSQARRTIADLEGQIISLKADLTFYRNIMAPSEVSEGLQVDRLTLSRSRGQGRHGFKLVLTQVGDNNSYIDGVVAVNVIGLRGGTKEVIALRDLSEEIVDLGVKFRFRYFQDIEGYLTVPDGFVPVEVQVVAQAQGRKASQAERTFEWAQLTEN